MNLELQLEELEGVRIDLVALKYAIKINGVTQLMMMKGDVLSGIETIKICKQYKIEKARFLSI